jgi:hypothetical protein
MSISAANANQSANFNDQFSQSLVEGKDKEKLAKAASAVLGGGATEASLSMALAQFMDSCLDNAQSAIESLQALESSGSGGAPGGLGGAAGNQGGADGGSGTGAKPSDTMKAQLAVSEATQAEGIGKSMAESLLEARKSRADMRMG